MFEPTWWSSAYAVDPGLYLHLVRRAAEPVDIPVIGSLNGMMDRGRVDYAREIEAVGASAVEFDIYFVPSDLDLSEEMVDQRHVDILKAMKVATRIPVAVKIGLYFSEIGHMAQRVDQAGAG